eukprot:1663801-Ditylum_brightwellii.AAC.2
MDHGLADTITRKHIRAGIESHKLELSCGTSFFTNNYRISKECATRTWWHHVWGFMWKSCIMIREETPDLQPQRENDNFLMQELVAYGYKG